MDSVGSDPAFNPYTQTITLLTPLEGPIPISISDIDDYISYSVRVCINYGTQIGASLLLLVCLLLTTRPEKRTSAIFILNALALLFNFIRSICQCIYFTGQFNEFYTYFSGDYSAVPQGQYGASVTGIVFTLLVVICIEASLALQVRCLINTPTVAQLHQRIITGLGSAIALLAIGFRLALTIQNSRAVLAAEDFTSGVWLLKTSTYIITASIVFFSFIFVFKLAVALRRRRGMLGLQQFGPMEIVFVMGCQTLIIPAVFAILQNFTDVPELGSQLLTVTAIFLPLTSLWAAASIDHTKHARNSKNTSGVIRRMGPKRGFLGSLLSRTKPPASDLEASNNSSKPLATTDATSSTLSSTPGTDEKFKPDRLPSESATSEFRINFGPTGGN